MSGSPPSPVVAQGVEWLGGKVEQLAHWIETGGLQRFGDTVNGWLQPLGSVAHLLGGDGGVLGAVEAVMVLMAGRFAASVIAPWWTLASAITAATAKLTQFMAAQAAGGGRRRTNWASRRPSRWLGARRDGLGRVELAGAEDRAAEQRPRQLAAQLPVRYEPRALDAELPSAERGGGAEGG